MVGAQPAPASTSTVSFGPSAFFSASAQTMLSGRSPASLRAARCIGFRTLCGIPRFFASMVTSRSIASPVMSGILPSVAASAP